MEKQSVWKKRSFYSRLLIFFICITNSQIFAATLSRTQIRELRVVPQNKIFFTGVECGYTLTLNGIEPSDVQTDLPNIPSGVQFLSSKRDEFIDSDGDRGTIVHLWFSFSDSGTFKLNPLRVMIKMRAYNLEFESVDVYENPKTIQPVLFVEFEDAKINKNSLLVQSPIGSKIRFTLYLKYAVQVIGFSWDLPKNSLFTELERYNITRGEPRGNGFSPDAIPVARFEWQPLVAGYCKFPNIHLTATAYNGAKKEPSLPEYNVLITESPSAEKIISKSISSPRIDSSFDYAFKEQFAENKPASSVTKIDCEKIASLRSAERHSFPWGSASKNRRAEEIKAGVSSGISEPSLPLLHLIFLFAVIFAACAVFLFIIRHFYSAIGVACLSMVFVILTALFTISLVPHYGVFAGGSVRPIPESDASSEQSVSAGARVKIVEKAGKWVYIDCTDSGGWVPSETVYKIR